MFVAALQVAGPLIAVLFLADVGLGLLTRVAPALNAFALGFPLKILLTVALGVSAYLALPNVVAALTETSVTELLGVTR
jgi:flagellar biosynthetic protein FliR